MQTVASIVRQPSAIRRWGNLIVASTLLVASAMIISGETVARRVQVDVARAAQASSALHATVLRSELAKHRSLPFVLAQDPDVIASLRSPGAARRNELSRKLESLRQGTSAAVIYVLDAEGRTISASNWREPTSFVGVDYSFRAYFRDAMRTGVAELFALGASSGRPGLYLAQRIADPAGPGGVVVVKAEFDRLEAEWSADNPAFATDADGVVLITSIPGWRFSTLSSLAPAEQTRLRAEQRFGAASLDRLAAIPALSAGAAPDLTTLGLPGHSPARFMAASAPLGTGGWNVFVLTPIGALVKAAVGAAWTVSLLVGVILTTIAAAVLFWRTQASVRAARQEVRRAELEARVEERTQELSSANRRLTIEMEERRRAEAYIHQMRDQLVQSNKLATLGQIAAGVAHEINQPLAAIRSYADNTTVYLERRDFPAAQGNLTLIADLTERIGLITDELRAFSRKSKTAPAPIRVSDAIDGALLLLAPRIRQQSAQVVVLPGASDLQVMAERFRLEQVLVNLLQNALEALEEAAAPQITINVAGRRNRVAIQVTDNGPGLSAEARRAVFTPFATTKPLGLGLGLVISRDIIAEFGGDLALEPASRAGGASFVINLSKAR